MKFFSMNFLISDFKDELEDEEIILGLFPALNHETFFTKDLQKISLGGVCR